MVGIIARQVLRHGIYHGTVVSRYGSYRDTAVSRQGEYHNMVGIVTWCLSQHSGITVLRVS